MLLAHHLQSLLQPGQAWLNTTRNIPKLLHLHLAEMKRVGSCQIIEEVDGKLGGAEGSEVLAQAKEDGRKLAEGVYTGNILHITQSILQATQKGACCKLAGGVYTGNILETKLKRCMLQMRQGVMAKWFSAQRSPIKFKI